MEDLFLGLDLGTSALKAGLFDDSGFLLASTRRAYPLYVPRLGWAEQQPEDWWTAVRSAVPELLERSAVDRARIAAVGLSGQTPGHVLVDAGGASLGRAIIWSDRRAAAEADWLAERITREQALAWTAYPLLADSALPPARLLWLKAHRPADWTHCAHVLQPKDFIALRLTGRAVTDNHSAFTLVNLETGRYDPEYFAFLGIPLTKMPTVLEPHEVVGKVVAEAAEQTGLLSGTPVVCGTIDAWCDIIGCGGVTPGRAVDVAGTSEVVALITDRAVVGESVFASSLLGDLYFTGGPTQAGGGALHWLARGFYPEMGDEPDFAQLETDAGSVEPGAGGLIFLPYLSGERAPIWDDAARAAFVGLAAHHARAYCARAVYEGVAFAVRHILTL
ncbi:MAG: FGGY family carbohydrate kinase, partial [Chloroflexota bacterium]|nr:FGGY family carbohydrate kinase [Chloroflexota bacterium]